jgi:very-short-patch-repair endonuclease
MTQNAPKPPLDPRLLTFAREMRQNATAAEALLWELLRNRRLAGFKFRRQVPIGGYIVDFYCHEARLGVELDGTPHDDPESEDYDDGRSTALALSDGMRMIRFWNESVLNRPEIVLGRILGCLNDLTLQPPSPQPSPGGRGSSEET